MSSSGPGYKYLHIFLEGTIQPCPPYKKSHNGVSASQSITKSQTFHFTFVLIYPDGSGFSFDKIKIMVTPPFYNTAPLGLLLYDIRLVVALLLFLPGIIFPLSPFRSAELDELFPSSANLTAIFFHFLYTTAQIAFLIFLFFFVFWARARFVIAYVAVFLLINYTLCNLTLNGRDRFITSDVDTSSFPRHDNERWIFINGVSVGYVVALMCP